MHGRDIFYFFKGGGKATNTPDIVFHEHHRGLRVIVNDFLDGHVFCYLGFTHGFTFFVPLGIETLHIRVIIKGSEENRTAGIRKKRRFN